MYHACIIHYSLIWYKYLRILQDMFVKNNGKRSVVNKMNLHIGSEYSVPDNGNRFRGLPDNIFIQFVGCIRIACFDEAGTIAFFTVGVQRKL